MIKYDVLIINGDAIEVKRENLTSENLHKFISVYLIGIVFKLSTSSSFGSIELNELNESTKISWKNED